MIPFIKNFEVEFNDEKNKAAKSDFGKIICKDINKQITDNADTYQKMKDCEYQYLGWSKYRQAGQAKNKPWDNACDFWAPLTEWVICAVAARIDQILFSVEPTMTASPVESSDAAGAPVVTDFADMVMREIVELRKNFSFYTKQTIKQLFAVCAYEWIYQAEPVREVEEGLLQEDFSVKMDGGEVIPYEEIPSEIQKDIENGDILVGTKTSWYVEKDRIITNQPKLTYIAPLDYVWSKGTKKNERPYLEGYRFWQTINDIKLKKNSEEYTLTDEEMTKLDATLASAAGGGEQYERILKQRNHKYECFRIYTRLPFNKQDKVDFDDKEAIEQEVILEVAYKEEIVLKAIKWFYLRHPGANRVFIKGWFEEKDTLTGDPMAGRSLSEKIFDINKLLNKEFQQIVDNADLAMTKIFTRKSGIGLNEDFEDPVIFPGAIWDVMEQGDIAALNVGDVKQIGFQIMDSLLGFATRISNISPLNVSDRAEGGKPLATEIISILKEGEIGREGLIQNRHEDLRNIYKTTVDYYYQFMPDKLEKRIRGPDQQLIFPPLPDRKDFAGGPEGETAYANAVSQAEKDKFYNREMLVGVGKWDFKWNGTQLSGDREAQIAIADKLADMLLKIPMAGNRPTVVWELLRDILISRGKKDWQKYLPKREEVETAEKMMEMKAKMTEIIPNLKQRLIEKGIPPQVAEQAIAILTAKEQTRQGQSSSGASGPTAPQPGGPVA